MEKGGKKGKVGGIAPWLLGDKRPCMLLKRWCCPKRKLNSKQFSLTGFFPDNFLTAVKFPDISEKFSGFYRQAVTL